MVDETADVGVSGGYAFEDGNLITDLLSRGNVSRRAWKSNRADTDHMFSTGHQLLVNHFTSKVFSRLSQKESTRAK